MLQQAFLQVAHTPNEAGDPGLGRAVESPSKDDATMQRCQQVTAKNMQACSLTIQVKGKIPMMK